MNLLRVLRELRVDPTRGKLPVSTPEPPRQRKNAAAPNLNDIRVTKALMGLGYNVW